MGLYSSCGEITYKMTPEVSLIAGGFTILGALIGTLCGYWLAKRLASHTARISACAHLRAAFAPTLVKLDADRTKKILPDDPVIDTYLRDGLEQIALAVEIFRPFVRHSDKAAYQEAFRQYRQAASDGLLVATAHSKDDPWSVIEQRIHEILRYGDT